MPRIRSPAPRSSRRPRSASRSSRFPSLPDRDDAAPAAKQRPYPPSWLQRLVDGLDALPGPGWLPIVGIGLLVGISTQIQAWENGVVPGGELNVPSLYWTSMAAALLWCTRYFRDLAGRSFDAFEPACSAPRTRVDKLRYELTVIPAAGSWIILGVAALLTVAAFVFAPEDALIVGVSTPILIASFITQVLAAAVLFTLGYQLLRQMRLVRQAMSEATVDLFRPGPLQALSRLTARSGIALVLIVGASVFIIPPPADFGSLLLNWAPFLVLPPIVAVIAFVVPLSGMHGRLEVEQARLMDDVDERLKRVFTQVNRDVDGGDLSRADGLNKALASVLQQRDVIAKLPTWPWSTGTFRAFVTALLLPIFLFLIQRVLIQFV